MKVSELPTYHLCGRFYGIPICLVETEVGAEFKISLLKEEGKRVIWIKENGEVLE